MSLTEVLSTCEAHGYVAFPNPLYALAACAIVSMTLRTGAPVHRPSSATIHCIHHSAVRLVTVYSRTVGLLGRRPEDVLKQAPASRAAPSVVAEDAVQRIMAETSRQPVAEATPRHEVATPHVAQGLTRGFLASLAATNCASAQLCARSTPDHGPLAGTCRALTANGPAPGGLAHMWMCGRRAGPCCDAGANASLRGGDCSPHLSAMVPHFSSVTYIPKFHIAMRNFFSTPLS